MVFGTENATMEKLRKTPWEYRDKGYGIFHSGTKLGFEFPFEAPPYLIENDRVSSILAYEGFIYKCKLYPP